MKRLKWIILLAIFAAAFVAACSEQESPTVGTTEQQQETQPGETAQQEPQPAEPAQQPGMTAQQEPETAQPTVPPGETAQQQEQQMTTGAGEQVEIAGTVEQTSEGLVIQSVDETYLVKGRDLSDMVGKDVKVTGSLEEGGERPTINVSDVTVIE